MEDKFLIMQTEDGKDLPLPKYQTRGSAGMDLHANVENEVVIEKGKTKLIKTGIKISIPEDYEVQVRARSGLALKYGITLLNSPGTIDSDYRGEINVILINLGENDYKIKRGERIAQIVVNKIERINFELVTKLDDTIRGERGFGHTGKTSVDFIY